MWVPTVEFLQRWPTTHLNRYRCISLLASPPHKIELPKYVLRCEQSSARMYYIRATCLSSKPVRRAYAYEMPIIPHRCVFMVPEFVYYSTLRWQLFTLDIVLGSRCTKVTDDNIWQITGCMVHNICTATDNKRNVDIHTPADIRRE